MFERIRIGRCALSIVAATFAVIVADASAQDSIPPLPPVPGATAPAFPEASAPAVKPAETPPQSPPATPAEKPAAAPAATAPATTPPAVSPPPTAPSDAAQSTDQVTATTLDDLKKSIDASTDLSDDQKKNANDFINLARADLTKVTEFAANFKAFQEKTKLLETDRQRLQTALDAINREKPKRFSDVTELPKLEQTLASYQQDLVNAQNELAQTEKQLSNRSDRQKAIKERLGAIPSELEKVNDDLTKAVEGSMAPLVLAAKRQQLIAARKRLENEPGALQAEATYLSAQEAANVIQLDRQAWLAKVSRLKEEVSTLQREVLRKKSSEAKDRSRVATEDAASTDIPALKGIYEANAKIVEDEIEYREKIKKLTDEINDAKARTDQITQKDSGLHDRKSKIGSSKTFGLLLRQELQNLPRASYYRQKIRDRVPANQEAQLELNKINDEIESPSVLDQNVELTMQRIAAGSMIGEETNESREQRQQLANRVRQAYEQQQAYLTAEQNAVEAYVSALSELDSQQELLVTAINDFQKFIDENILWVPTSSVLNFQEVTSDSTSLQHLLDRSAWWTLWKHYVNDFLRQKLLYVMAALIWGTLVFTHSKQRETIRANGQKASSRLNTTMKPTWVAISATILKSLVLPFPFLFLAWRGTRLGGDVEQLAQYILTISIWLFWLELVRTTCRDRGLGGAHFQWPERVNRSIRIQLSTLIGIATPLIFVIAFLQSRSTNGESQPIERVCIIAFHFLLAFTLYRLTARKTGILREWTERHPGGWMDRLSIIWNWLALAVPLILIGLTIAGYNYAVEKLSVRLAETLMLVFAAVFARSFLFRWLTLRQRRLAIEHAREVRAALAESKGQEESAQAVKMEAQEVRTNLVEVSAQSKRLLNTTIVILSLACCWLIWADVLPALKKLDTPVPGTTLTFSMLLTATVKAILFTTAARNIPGLLEMVLLERLPLDRSTRYAVGALTRYAIAVLGILSFGASLGIRWDDVQWLVAALTFALGFGLQEIFANFVSGVIILFEQPVRVGDIVTIDSVTGTVSRIRIRATTITDWDRKDYIVPNKEFITGRLLNWTLTDTTNRIIVNIGVSYNADPSQVRELLLKIVRTQPIVLADPAPVVSFEGFGESALNFVMRAYLPSLENRTETIHQLHVRIFKEFEAAGIEIPFPQRDLHVRTTVPFPVQQTNGAAKHAESDGQPADVEEEQELENAYD